MATATAVVESLDAPMVDFEYTMQSESTTADVWYPESTMDDGDMAMDSFVGRDGDEVDMEPREDTDIEYDMVADEPNEYTSEAIDIEVFDAPPAAPHESAPHVDIPHAIIEETPSAVESTTIPELSEPVVTHVDHAVYQISEVVTLPPQGPHVHSPLVENAGYNPTFQVASGAEQLAETGTIAEQYSHVNIVESEPTTAETTSETPFAPVAVASATELSTVDSNEPTATSVAEREATDQHTEHGDAFPPAVAAAVDENEPIGGSEAQQEPPVEHDVGNDSAALEHDVNRDGEPRLEGQYHHDPAPAILLSLSTSEPEWSLFCQPNPPPNIGEVRSGDMPLLFQDRQELFYEPLINFIEGLRQQTAVTQSSHFADGEMVVDAYDLDLTIAEDNVYSREVTLHDLTMLHQGSRLGGPLRLRVYFTTSRFILRYQELREHVARMNLTEGGGVADGEEGHVDNVPAEAVVAAEDEGGYGEQALEGHVNDDGPPPDEEDEPQVGGEYEEHGPVHEEPTEDQDDGPDEQEQNQVSDEVQDYGNEDDREAGVPATEDLNAAAQDSVNEPVLDADQVHSHDDVADATTASHYQTEYEEYTEYNEDYDERYGDDVPEGGNDDVLAGDHAEVPEETAPTEESLHEAVSEEHSHSVSIEGETGAPVGASGGEAEDQVAEADYHGDAQGYAGEASFVEVEELLNDQQDDDDEYSTETLSDHHDTTYVTAYEEPTDERSFDGTDDVITHANDGTGRLTPNPTNEDTTHITDVIEPPEDDDDWGDDEQEVVVGAPSAGVEAASTESSNTLFNSTASKRGRGDADPDKDDFDKLRSDSPGSKRVRVE